MQFNQPMAQVKRDMEERIFDMRQVLQLIDGGVVGQLLQVDAREGTHMELWVD